MKCDIKKCKAWCCKQFWVHLPEVPNPDMMKYWEYHGILVIGNVMTVPARCKHLTKDNKCGIYDSPQRPQFCKDWYCDGKWKK